MTKRGSLYLVAPVRSVAPLLARALLVMAAGVGFVATEVDGWPANMPEMEDQ